MPPKGQRGPLAASVILFLYLYGIKQAASASVLTPALLLRKQTSLYQISNSPLYRPAGKTQFLCYGSDGWIALIVLVAPVFQIHIHRLGAVRQFSRINCRKISHRQLPQSVRNGGRCGAPRCSLRCGAGECCIPPFEADTGGSGGRSLKSSS